MANRYPYHHPSFQPRTGGMGMPPVAIGLTTQQPGVDMNGVSRFPGLVTGVWNQQGPVQSWVQPQQQRPAWDNQQKEREYLKQQQKLRAMSYSNKKSPVTADALIENLLGQKETFVLKKNEDMAHEKQIITPDGTLANGSTKSNIPDRTNMAPHHSTAHQRISSAKDSIAVNTRFEEKEKGPHPVVGSALPGSNLPHWASGMTLPPMYDRIWEAVACPLGSGLADTGLLFPLLLTSGLQREVLGHIWAIANRTVPGRLTRPELNTTLALIALAQSGHSFCNLSVLEALPQPLVPNLDLSTLPASKRVNIEVPITVSPVPICPATSRADLNAPVAPVSNPSKTTPSSSILPENSKTALDDDWDEFTEFQSASSSSVLGASLDPPAQQLPYSESSTKSSSSNAFSSSATFKSEKPIMMNSVMQTPIIPCIPLSVPAQGNRLLSAESSPVLSSRSSSEGRGIGSRLANHTLGAPKVSSQGLASKSHEPSEEDDYDDFCEFRSGPPPNNSLENSSKNKFSAQENAMLDDLFPRCIVRPFKPEILRESAIRAEPTGDDTFPPQKGSRGSDSKESSSNVQTWMSTSNFMINPSKVPKKDSEEKKLDETNSEVKLSIPVPPVMSVEKDRYSALRALAEEISPPDIPSKEDEEDDDDDDDFGDFLSARGTPAAPISEDSFTEIAREGVLGKESTKDLADDPFNMLGAIAADPQPVNSTDWSADFSAFEEDQTTRREINNNEAIPNNDDEFGDFVGGGGRDEVIGSLRLEAGWLGGERRGEGSIGTGEASPDSRSINAATVEGDGNGIGRARTGSLPSLDLKGFTVMGVGEGEGSSGEEGDGVASGEGRRTFGSSMSGEKCSLESWEAAKSAGRHAYEWRRCLASCLSLLQSALLIFSSISSSEVIEEVVSTEEGEDYLSNLLEVYWVSRRIAASYQQLDRRDAHLDSLLDDIGTVWEGLLPFYEKSGIMEMEYNLDIRASDGVRKGDGNNGSYCGVCLASVPGDVDGEPISQGLSYGGHHYHTTCANLWVNCVDRLLPSLQHISHML